MLKMASESFIHALLLFLGLFLKISRLFLFFLLMVVTLFFVLLYCEMVVDVESLLTNLAVWNFNIDDRCTCGI